MFPDHCCELFSAKHPRDFRNPVLAFNFRNPRPRPSAGHRLRHHQVPVAVHGALRQVRDRDHLMPPRDRPHLLTDDLPDLPADVRVNFIKYKRNLFPLPSSLIPHPCDLEGKHNACDLTRTRDCRERTRRLARIRLEHVDNAIHTVRLRLDRLHCHEELRLQEPEVAKLLRHGPRQLLRRGRAQPRQLRANLPHRLVRHRDLRIQLRNPLLPVLQRIQLRLLRGEGGL